MVQSNARFKIDIYGDTANFENSLKGVNSAVNGLKGEAAQLRRELRLDPGNNTKLVALQKNLQQQLSVTKQRATLLRQELSQVDRSTPAGQNKYVQLQRQLKNAEIQAGFLEKELDDVDNQIKNPSRFRLDTGQAQAQVDSLRNRFSSLREVAIGALRQIGSSAISALGNGFRSIISDTSEIQRNSIALRNTLDFSGLGSEYDSLSARLQGIATATNASTQDTLRLGTTFIGLGNDAQTAGDKVENIVKANQAFGGTGENLKGVVQAYSQISASGKVSAENINQLTDNNTALGAALKKVVYETNPALKQFGSFAGASEAGAISVAMLDKALQSLGQAGGAGTETIEDSFASLQETLAVALLPVLEAITPYVTNFLNSITDNIPAAIEYLGQLYENFKNVFQTIQDNQALVDVFVASLGALSVIAVVSKAFTGLVTAINLVRAAWIILSAVFASSGIGTIITLVAALVAGLVYFFTQTETGTQVWAALVQFLQNVISGLVSFFQSSWASITQFASDTVNNIQSFFTPIVSFFSGLFSGIASAVSGGFNAVITFAVNAVNAIYNFWRPLINFYASIFRLIGSIVNVAFQLIYGIARTIFNNLVSLWTTIGGVFSTVFGVVSRVVSAVFNAVLGFAQRSFQGMYNIARSVASAIGSAFNFIVGPLSVVFNAVFGFAQRSFQGMVNIASSVANGITSAFSGIVGFFSSIFGAVANIASSVLGGITSTINNIAGAINGVAGKIKGFFGGAMVAELREVSMASAGFVGNSATAQSTSTANTFNIQAGALDITQLARAIKREIDNGRA